MKGRGGERKDSNSLFESLSPETIPLGWPLARKGSLASHTRDCPSSGPTVAAKNLITPRKNRKEQINYTADRAYFALKFAKHIQEQKASNHPRHARERAERAAKEEKV